MVLSFDSKVADVIGVEAATMIYNLNFWIIKNKANNRNFNDGYYWTYNTQEAFSKLFTFWSRRQVQRILKKLEDEGYIITGNYNKAKYDQTKWYALTKKGDELVGNEVVQCNAPNGAMEITESCNGNNQMVQPIPDNKPDNNNKDIYIDEIWNLYPNKQGKANSIKKIPSIVKEIGIDKLKQCIENYKNTVAAARQTGFNQQYMNGSTFFNGRYMDYMEEIKLEIGYNSKPRDFVPVNEINDEMMKHLENDF